LSARDVHPIGDRLRAAGQVELGSLREPLVSERKSPPKSAGYLEIFRSDVQAVARHVLRERRENTLTREALRYCTIE
jgi:hypothetical protein